MNLPDRAGGRKIGNHLRPVAGLSNAPVLEAVRAGASLVGHVIVRRDGSTTSAPEARAADWLDLLAQLDEEPIGPGPIGLV
jgi:hypothetical protein